MRTLGGERRGSLLAAIDRTMTAAGIAASGAAARRAADRCGGDRSSPRRGRSIRERQRRARRAARTPESGTRSCARLDPPRDRTRRSARSRRHSRRHLASAAIAERYATLGELPRDLARAAEALREPDGALAAELDRALGDELPALRRDGGFVRGELRACPRRGARAARRIAPRHRRAAGALCRRDRHPLAEDPAQQRARLFRRRHRAARRETARRAAQRDLHSPPDARRPGALHAPPSSASWRRRSPTRPIVRWRSSSTSSIGCAATVAAGSGAIKRARRGAGRARRRRRRSRCSRSSAITCVRKSMTASPSPSSGGRHPVVEQALRRDGGPFVANDCDLSPRAEARRGPAASGCSPGRTWRANRPSCARTR